MICKIFCIVLFSPKPNIFERYSMKEIGLLLRQTREERGLTIDDAASELKIRKHYLEVIESGNASSLVDEIYVIGYLKGYANWLGMNGSQIVAKLKKEHSDLSINGNISNESSAFFSLEDYCVNPNVRLVLLSIFIFIAVYISFSVSDTPLDNGFIYSSFKEQKGLASIKGDGRQLILMANEELNIYITSSEGEKTSKRMSAGEIYFLPNDKDKLVTSDNPAALDVFLDQKENSFLGTLESIS